MDAFLLTFIALVAASIVMPFAVTLLRERRLRRAELARYLEDEERNRLRGEHAVPLADAPSYDAPASLIASSDPLTTFDAPFEGDDQQLAA